MKNSIHDYYSKLHRNDPCLNFDECLDSKRWLKKSTTQWLLRGAIAAMLVLGIVILPLLENYTNSGNESSMQEIPLAAAQNQAGESGNNEAEMRQPERNRVADAEILPITTVAPEYPAQALDAGIEGWVLVTFIVTAAGGVADAQVTDAEPLDTFDAAALEAIEQFQFNPRMVNGESVDVEGVRYLFRFNP